MQRRGDNSRRAAARAVCAGLYLAALSFVALPPAGGAPSGTVIAWGSNEYGETGVPVAALSGVTAIAAGYDHTVALKDDGSVVAWGNNIYGLTSVPVAAQSGVTAIAAGYQHAVALMNNGSVAAWGNGFYSQTNVPMAAQSEVTAIAAGAAYTVALKNDGSVLAWGDNSYGQTTVPVVAQSGVMAIAAGWYHVLALKNDGSVVAWGAGTNSTGSFLNYNQSVVPVAAQSGVVAIAAGGYHSLALKNDGSVVAWGRNAEGESSVPVAAQSGVAAIAGGWAHTVVLKNDGTVVVWGRYLNGQTNVPVAARSGVVAIAAGYRHTVALVTPHTPIITAQPASQTANEGQPASFSVGAMGQPAFSYQWRKDGVDIVGAIGATYGVPFARPEHAGSYTVVVRNVVGSVTSTPVLLTVNPVSSGAVVVWGWGDPGWGHLAVPVAAQSNVTAIAAGGLHNVALKNDGPVLVWGNGREGQTNIPVAAQSGVIAISAGSYHVMALKNDGSVVAWGAGTNDPGTYPHYGQSIVPVEAQSGVIAISAGGFHSVALKSNGTVVAWGWNRAGLTTTVPLGLNGVTAISAGNDHTLALKDDGTVVAWGVNSYGQTDVPPGLSGVIAIAAGFFDNLALKYDGSVVTWGNSCCGTDVVPIAARSGVVAIAVGGYHGVALKSNGTVVAWGEDIANGATRPAGLTGVTAISAGSGHTLALVVPSVPVAHGQSVTAIECTATPITLTASASDGAPLTFAIERSPEHGTLSGTPPNMVYTPARHFTGLDAFSFTASNGQRRSLPTNIVIAVHESQRVITATITADQLVAFHPDFEHPVLISCNWWNSCLVLDGTRSTSQDACGEDSVLSHLWFVEPEPVPFASGPVVTNCLEVGTHTIILAVNDTEGLTDMEAKTIEVVTAPLAIDLLIEKVNESRLARKTKRELVATLRVALNRAGRERLRETQTALDAFEKKVRALVAQSHPLEATEWIRWSQAVSEGIESCFKPVRKPKNANDKSGKGDGPR